MESKELIVTMLCYVGVLLEICIEYVINRCHYFGWYELGFNCCVFAMVLIVVLVVCWIYFLFVKGYTNNYMGLLPWVFFSLYEFSLSIIFVCYFERVLIKY